MAPDQQSGEELFTARGAADLSHVSPQTVKMWATAKDRSPAAAAAVGVVAKAVAVAMEAVAPAAAEAIAERAVEVAQAKQRVAYAAAAARGEREAAATMAAHALARDVEQAAKLVQDRADVSAAQS